MSKRSTQWHEKLRQKVLSDPESRAEYEAFSLQLELADKMKKMRLKKQITQEYVAEIMDTNKTVVSRLEAAGGKGKHSPSINTLAKYASAIGYKLQIKFVPQEKVKHAP